MNINEMADFIQKEINSQRYVVDTLLSNPEIVDDPDIEDKLLEICESIDEAECYLMEYKELYEKSLVQ